MASERSVAIAKHPTIVLLPEAVAFSHQAIATSAIEFGTRRSLNNFEFIEHSYLSGIT
jgi:hypothetical protein